MSLTRVGCFTYVTVITTSVTSTTTTTIALFVHKLNTQKYNKRRLFELEKQRMKKNIHQYDCICSRVHSYMHACVHAPMCVLVAGELKEQFYRL